MPITCEHCFSDLGWTKQKRLCDHCWKDRSISELYGGKDGLLEVERLKDPPLPELPTNTEPGSEENLQVLAERYRLGQDLHHPGDKKAERPPVTRNFLGGLFRGKHLG